MRLVTASGKFRSSNPNRRETRCDRQCYSSGAVHEFPPVYASTPIVLIETFGLRFVAPIRLFSFDLSCPNARTVTYFAVPGMASFVGFPDFLSFFSAGPDGIEQPSVLPFTQICFKYSELPYR